MTDVADGRGGIGAFELLRTQPAFRRLYIAQLLSQGGDWFAIVPLLILLLQLNGNPVWGALVLTADTIAIAVLSPYAGTVVDRIDRRTLMVACDVSSAGFTGLLFFVREEKTSFIAVIAIGAVAAAKAFFTPSSNAAVPYLVPRSGLLTATVISGAIWAVMLIVGSSASALMAAAFGPYWCFGIDIVSFLCSAALVVGIHEQLQPPRRRNLPRPSIFRDIAQTLRITREDPRIGVLVFAKPGTGLGNGILALFPVLAVTVFHIGPVAVGVLFAARGLGALVGPLIARRFLTRARRIRSIVATAIVLFGVGYILFPLVGWFWVAACCVAAAHIGGSAAASISTYGLQLVAPEAARGRVMSTDFMLQTLFIGVSQLLVIGIAAVIGDAAATMLTGAAVLAYGAVWWLASRSLRSLSH